MLQAGETTSESGRCPHLGVTRRAGPGTRSQRVRAVLGTHPSVRTPIPAQSSSVFPKLRNFT